MPSLKDLLNCPWQDIAKLSDKELEAIGSPYFHITRPSEVARRKKAEGEVNAIKKAGMDAASSKGSSFKPASQMQPDKARALKAEVRRVADAKLKEIEDKMKQMGLNI